MQQPELFPELTTTEPYIGVEFTDGDDVYVSTKAKNCWYIDGRTECEGCVFENEEYLTKCNKSEETLSCSDNPIIWIKKG